MGWGWDGEARLSRRYGWGDVFMQRLVTLDVRLVAIQKAMSGLVSASSSTDSDGDVLPPEDTQLQDCSLCLLPRRLPAVRHAPFFIGRDPAIDMCQFTPRMPVNSRWGAASWDPTSVDRLAAASQSPRCPPPTHMHIRWHSPFAIPCCAVHGASHQRHQIPLAGERPRAWSNASLRVPGRHRAVRQRREHDARPLMCDEQLDSVVHRQALRPVAVQHKVPLYHQACFRAGASM